MRLRIVVVVAVVALLAGGVESARAQGQPISQVVVLGDSLSDNGNLCGAIGYPPSPPYWLGRSSNGPVAVEYLAQSLGVLLKDFAWWGATTGVGNFTDGGTVDGFGAGSLPGMTTVFQGALSAGEFPIDPNALYVVWGGPNDFWMVDGASASVAVQKAVANLVTMVGQLQSLGARQILVLNMPDLGRTPYLLALPPQIGAFFTQVSLVFDQALKASLPAGVRYFDTFSLLSAVLANPAAYGFTNVNAACLTPLSICANPDQYLFWDIVHFTTAGHALVADAVRTALAQTVVIGGCDSGVPDVLAGGGFTISELIAQAAAGARNHGQFVSRVASITNGLVTGGVLSGRQKGAIQSCAGKY